MFTIYQLDFLTIHSMSAIAVLNVATLENWESPEPRSPRSHGAFEITILPRGIWLGQKIGFYLSIYPSIHLSIHPSIHLYSWYNMLYPLVKKRKHTSIAATVMPPPCPSHTAKRPAPAALAQAEVAPQSAEQMYLKFWGIRNRKIMDPTSPPKKELIITKKRFCFSWDMRKCDLLVVTVIIKLLRIAVAKKLSHSQINRAQTAANGSPSVVNGFAMIPPSFQLKGLKEFHVNYLDVRIGHLHNQAQFCLLANTGSPILYLIILFNSFMCLFHSRWFLQQNHKLHWLHISHIHHIWLFHVSPCWPNNTFGCGASQQGQRPESRVLVRDSRSVGRAEPRSDMRAGATCTGMRPIDGSVAVLKWGYPDSWMLYLSFFMENPSKIWMIWGYLSYFLENHTQIWMMTGGSSILGQPHMNGAWTSISHKILVISFHD